MNTPDSRRAEELFVAFLARRDAGESVDLDALCAAHPEHSTAFRELDRAVEVVRRLGIRMGGSTPLSASLEQRYGPEVDPGVELEKQPEADSGPQSKLFQKLRLQGPRGLRYKLIGEVAKGGMGAILRVWDEDLRRTLAMKVVLGKSDAPSGQTPPVDPRTLGRFLEEAQITGQLDHPGIVPVHELGLDAEGRAYFTMRLVKGEDLRTVFEHVRTGKDGWSKTRALGVLLKVCEAMSFAHAKGVIHRDLKPANVMVGKFGEVYVMDWGLARVLGREDKHDLRLRRPEVAASSAIRTERHEERGETPDSPLVTMDGDVVGTPSFMPPEQARGELERLGPHSDVYSIGAMLYQLVTGAMPYVPAGAKVSPYTILGVVLREPPEAIEKLAPRTPAELVAIVEKAMSRDMACRYSNTLALAADLRAYLERRVVAAYETGSWAEARKWIARNRPLAASLAAATLAVVSGAIAFAWKAGEASRRAREAREGQYLAGILGAQAARRMNELANVRRLLDSAPEELRNWEWMYLDAASDRSLRKLEGREARFSPDGTRIATMSAGNIAKLWDSATGAELARLEGHSDALEAIEFSPDGTRVATSSDDDTMRVWDVATGSLVARMEGHSGYIPTVSFSPDGARLVTASDDGTARVWNAATGRELATLRGHSESVESAAFDPTGNRLVTASDDGTARVWDARTGKELARLEGHDGQVASAAFDSGGARVITASYDNTARVWSAESGKELDRLEGHSDWVVTAEFSRDGARIVTASHDCTARIWDAATGKELKRLEGHSGKVRWAAFSPDGTRIVTASEDSTARQWDVSTGREIARLEGHTDEVRYAAFDRDGTHILTWSGHDTRIWDAATDDEKDRLRGRSRWLSSAEFSPDGARIVTASGSSASVWCAVSGRELGKLEGHSDEVTSVAFSPDGALVATASGDLTARVWDATTGREISRLAGHDPWGLYRCSAEFSPDGTRIVTAFSDDAARIWDVATGRELGRLRVDSSLVRSAAFSADSTRIVTSSDDDLVRIWNTAAGSELARWKANTSWAQVTVFSPDDTRIVTASDIGIDRGTVHLWNASTGAEIVRLEGHRDRVLSAQFSRDGGRLVTASDDGTARVWDTLTGSELARLDEPDDRICLAVLSPDGARMLTSSTDRAARIWDAVPYRLRLEERRALAAAEPAGKRALERALEGTSDLAEAGARLREDPSLDALVRHAALDEIFVRAESAREWMRELRRSSPLNADVESRVLADATRTPEVKAFALAAVRTRENASQLDEFAWNRVVSSTNTDVTALETALRCAERAVELDPSDSSFVNTLGVALYRSGRIEEALATLRRSEELRSARGWTRIPANVAFLSMARWRLGQADEARAELEVLEELVGTDTETETTDLLFEARMLIAPRQQGSQ